jgi:hypothetical protein
MEVKSYTLSTLVLHMKVIYFTLQGPMGLVNKRLSEPYSSVCGEEN